ncbi:xanthine dehydrogenase family protein molybdopterin-binding subunit [Paucibacter sp. Y2R2-4]|uniref:xanthine dehydrogenase family protein molybdopterin-binding subunit n=1 Tax=Paucibacter sp. Y2R2-4 TaxID=2893553 RepID=UPI0021E50A16|nr:xanthine dehydrogenase family protein molybdopterin-binding subunit [Paucibacter sp. Y2R2-4]MCV2349394.1 xanthine dehydrogenase family protein molybdopterin-binding subunit [Paucibacter sp. Y2R2-4]
MKRRGFLIAGGLLGGGALLGVSLSTPPSAQSRLGDKTIFPASGEQVALNGWVKIMPDGRVIVASPRAEMGQGVHTALAMLVAEEMDADWAKVSTEQAPVAQIYANTALLINVIPFSADDDSTLARLARRTVQKVGYALSLQVTGGSSSVRDAWEPMRLAGATARAMLVDAAAQSWGVSPESCSVQAGVVSHAASGRKASFGELAAATATIAPRSEVKLKDPRAYQLIGKPTPRTDIPAKVNGSAEFGIDVRPDGLLYAAIRHSPVFGGKVARFDAAKAKASRGVSDAFVIQEQAVVVLADRYWRAKTAIESLDIEWADGPHAQLDSAQISAQLQAALQGSDSGTGFRSQGGADKALSQAKLKLEATYSAPFLAHAAMEPINCTAQFKDGHLTVWCGTQVASLARWRAAKVAGLETEQVTLHVPLLGGGFGRRLELDMIEEAVLIAKQTQGRPVKLVWSREEDMQHDMYRPAALASFAAALDEQGQPSAWLNRVAAPSIGLSTTERLLPSFAADSPDKNHIEGAFDLPYAVPNLSVRQLRVKTPVPVGSWRSVGHSYNAFFTEGFIDELAHAAGKDPFEYRRALLADKPRHRQVLELAAAKAGWAQALPAGRARGIAVHESFGSWCAQVAEVSLEGGQVRVHRVVCAIDCGVVVNPDTVEAQMQSAIVYGLSAALFGEITLKKGRVEQSNFPSYEAIRMAQMPQIEVHILPSSAAPGGVGEPGTPPIAPAVANALFALSGERLRDLPLRPKTNLPAKKQA